MGLEKAAAAGGQNGGALPEAVQGAADGKQQAEKPAAQKRRYTIGRHAEPDDSNADAGGKNVVAEKEKLLSQAIQKSVKGGLRIEQGTEEGKRKQHLPPMLRGHRRYSRFRVEKRQTAPPPRTR